MTERTVKSGIWVTLTNVFDRVLQLGRLVVLARILSPADFGLMGIALLTLAVLRQFSQLGIDTALIQREEENIDHYLNTAWSMKIARSVIIAAVAFLLAPYAAAFFNEPRTTDIIRVLALTPLIGGFHNPGPVYFGKDLEFHKDFVYSLSGTVANVAVAIPAALVFQNVWALVFGSLAAAVTSLLVSYVIHDYRPRPTFDFEQARELFGYGKWIFGSGIVLFLINQGDDAFVGWFLGAAALGFYQMAYRFSNAPATEITHVISRVVFPAYSKVQSEQEKLREGYLRTVQLTTVISFPAAAGIVVISPIFVEVFLGSKWLPMVLPMQVLAMWGAIRSLGATVGPLFEALGRPDVNTKLQALKLVLIAVFIYPATAMWGITGTALVIVGNSLITNPLADYFAITFVDGSYKRFVQLIGYPFIGSLVMAISVAALDMTLTFQSPFFEFLILVVSGILIYIIIIYCLERIFDYRLEPTIRLLINAMKQV